MSYKPTNYTTVSPYLIVDDARSTIEFLVNAFDALELRYVADETNRLMHAEVRIDDTVVMLADSADGWPAIPAHVHVYVPEVDTSYQRALEAGATSVQAPLKKDDEDKRSGVSAGGITWWISTKIE